MKIKYKRKLFDKSEWHLRWVIFQLLISDENIMFIFCEKMFARKCNNIDFSESRWFYAEMADGVFNILTSGSVGDVVKYDESRAFFLISRSLFYLTLFTLIIYFL